MPSASLRRRIERLEAASTNILAGIIRVPHGVYGEAAEAWGDAENARLEAQGYRHDPRYGVAVVPEDSDDASWAVVVAEHERDMQRWQMWDEAIAENRARVCGPCGLKFIRNTMVCNQCGLPTEAALF